MNNKYIEYKVRNNLSRITGTYMDIVLFNKLYILYTPDFFSKQSSNYLFNLNNIINVHVPFPIPPVNSIKIILNVFQFFAEWVQLRRITDPE